MSRSELRFLITGATGFAGRHLLRHLRQQHPDASLHGTTLTSGVTLEGVTLHELDLCDGDKTAQLLQDSRPQFVAHLAAMSSPRQSFAQPWPTIRNNLLAQINLLEACAALPTQARVLVVTTSDIYDPTDDPVSEDSPFLPTSPYAVSKIAQDMHALQFGLERGLQIVRARPFNFMGPGQEEGFVAADFAWQVARIEARLQSPVINVGNLAARRDFCDVRDVVRAFSLLLARGTAGQAYNVASGKAHSIRSLLDRLLAISTVAIEVRVDESRLVPLDVPLKRGDNRRLREATGWQPGYSLDQSLRDLLQHCRDALRA
ncbi:MAG: GDP-mannose 4,6-dehydratase [Anaerolineaceae bacterium]|nr:GDP-mannose 4,6-dehydratase [Anaerolineaceae bacterium]